MILLWHAGGVAHGQGPPGAKAAPVKVSVDTSEVPELAPWGEKAKGVVEEWYPVIADLLKSDGFTPPAEVRLVFKNMRGIAYTSGNTITISARWIQRHPEDFGMVIHELTHVVQDYRRPGRRPGWLVEGIADYVRFFHYEPQTKLKVNPKRANYKQGYRTAAAFLAWIEKTHDKEIVRKLNEALRKSKYKDELFKTYTSKTLDELWAAFLASVERKTGVPAARPDTPRTQAQAHRESAWQNASPLTPPTWRPRPLSGAA